MKIKNFKIIKAYIALMKLENETLKVTEAMELFRLKKKLSDHFEFYRDQEKKYSEQYGDKVNEDGTIVFTDNNKKFEFVQKMNELNDMDIEIDIHEVSVTSNDINISMSDIEALDGFVKFAIDCETTN